MLPSAPRRGPEKGAGRRGFGRLRQERSGRWSAAYTGPDTALHRPPQTFDAKDDATAWQSAERRLIEFNVFFWHSADRVEEMRAESGTPDASKPLPEQSPKKAGAKLFLSRIDVFVDMLVSTAAMFAIMVSTSSTIGRNGPVTISTAAEAANALEPIAGPLASAVFSIGFIATGVLAVPVLASSGSIALAGLMGKPWGFDRSPRRAPLFYALIGVGTLGGVAITYFTNNPIGMLVLSATINGIAAAPSSRSS